MWTRTPVREIGAFFGNVGASAVCNTVRKTALRRAEDRLFRRKLGEVEKVLMNNEL
jgi:hypothetical protein